MALSEERARDVLESPKVTTQGAADVHLLTGPEKSSV